MAIVTTPLGFQKPDGLDPVRNGDNVISVNADKAEQRFTEDRGRLAAIESTNVTQGNRLTTVESENTMQEGALANHEARITAAEADIPAARTNAVADAAASADGKIGPRTIALDGNGKPYIAATGATHYLLAGADGIPYYKPTIARSITMSAGKPTIT